MSEHRANLTWQRGGAAFDYKSYPREHRVDFGDGHTLACTAAAEFRGEPTIPDPEQAFVGALSSCHMLTFLAICSLKKLTIDEYVDEAVGYLEKDADGNLVLARVELHPVTKFADGVAVDAKTLADLHDQAHHKCFLANSVKTQITTVLKDSSP